MRLAPQAPLSDAADAAFLSSSYGLTPDPWQLDVLDGWLGVKADGKLAAPRCGLAVPRQNGKNGAIEVAELFKMIVKSRRVLHTAHEVKTARKAFLRLVSFFDNPRMFPELADLTREVRRTNGQEAIVLHNGGSVEFVARSKGSGRGFSVDDLVMDEAQDLTEEQLAALLPTISASDDPQQIMTGTPPPPDGTAGEVFWRVRSEGVDGTSSRLCWIEYGCDEDVDLDDVGQWERANPALGIRLHLDTVRDERAAFNDETFGRERLGIWGRSRRSAVIPPDVWQSLTELRDVTQRPKLLDPVVFAVTLTPDHSTASVGMCGIRSDGLPLLEVVENRKGKRTEWVVPRMVELQEKWSPCAILLDPAGPAGSLLADLETAGVKVTTVSQREMAQACGALFDAATTDKVRHLGQPSLNMAVDSGRKRLVGDAWVWQRRDPNTDISPLEAVTLALFGWAKFGRIEPKNYQVYEF